MQRLPVQCLQQLHGSNTTDDQRLQRLLLTGCCRCLLVLQVSLVCDGAHDDNRVKYSVSVDFKSLLDTPHVAVAAVVDLSTCDWVAAILYVTSPISSRQVAMELVCRDMYVGRL